MHKAKAILTDAGSVTGHMASLAREFKIPTILNLKTAVAAIENGRLITVDADAGRVYSGKVEALMKIDSENKAVMKKTPVYETLRKLADLIIPLNLVDPKSPDFSPDHCRTVHDLMRLLHELSYGEVFQISDLASGKGGVSVKLNASLPIDLYIIDLDGGLNVDMGSRRMVEIEHITSIPFKALLSGMLHSGLRGMEPRPVDFSGFFSVLSRQMLSPPNIATERFGDRSYAIISDKYMNFSSRVAVPLQYFGCLLRRFGNEELYSISIQRRRCRRCEKKQACTADTAYSGADRFYRGGAGG